jgi:hypothetical protein
VLPREHILTFRDMGDDRWRSFESIGGEIRAIVSQRFDAPTLMFEHGPGKVSRAAGCGVDHAHMHVVPWLSPLIHVARQQLMGERWRQVDGVKAVREAHAQLDYLFLQDCDGLSWVYEGNDVPSQFFRRCLAIELGIESSYRWQSARDESVAMATLERFK